MSDACKAEVRRQKADEGKRQPDVRGERLVGRTLRAHSIKHRPIDLPPLIVREVALIESDLTPQGPVHTSLWTETLQEAPRD